MMDNREAKTARKTGSKVVALEQCERCESKLVQPEEWTEVAAGSWSVTLVCPNCNHERHGTFGQATVDAFDAELDAGYAAVLSSLQEIVTANLNAEIEVFVAALEADAILPEDF